jgi:hypothetical protein
MISNCGAVHTDYTYISVLAFTTLKMVTCEAETCRWSLRTKIVVVNQSAFVGPVNKIMHVINALNKECNRTALLILTEVCFHACSFLKFRAVYSHSFRRILNLLHKTKHELSLLLAALYNSTTSDICTIMCNFCYLQFGRI